MLKLTRNELAHWRATQVAALASFNFWSKTKVSSDFVVKLASEIADRAVCELRKRK